MSFRATRSLYRLGLACLFSVMAVAVGCEAEQGMKSPPIVPGKTDGDVVGGDDASTTDGSPGATDGTTSDTPTPPGDSGGGPLTCEDLSIMFVEGITDNSEAYTTCTKDGQCELLVPKLKCGKPEVVVVEDCNISVSDPLGYGYRLVEVTNELCSLGLSDCIATPGCPAAHAACKNGRCVSELDEP